MSKADEIRIVGSVCRPPSRAPAADEGATSTSEAADGPIVVHVFDEDGWLKYTISPDSAQRLKEYAPRFWSPPVLGLRNPALGDPQAHSDKIRNYIIPLIFDRISMDWVRGFGGLRVIWRKSGEVIFESEYRDLK